MTERKRVQSRCYPIQRKVGKVGWAPIQQAFEFPIEFPYEFPIEFTLDFPIENALKITLKIFMKLVVGTCLLFKLELKWKSDWKLKRLLNRHPDGRICTFLGYPLIGAVICHRPSLGSRLSAAIWESPILNFANRETQSGPLNPLSLYMQIQWKNGTDHTTVEFGGI